MTIFHATDIYLKIKGGYIAPSSINWVEEDDKRPGCIRLSLHQKDRPVLLNEEDSKYVISYLEYSRWLTESERLELSKLDDEDDDDDEVLEETEGEEQDAV